MNDPLQLLLQQSGSVTPVFPPSSRYHQTAIAPYTTAEGRVVAYLRRRFVPPAAHFSLLQEHTVSEGERLDHIAANHLGDAQQYWQICDANGAVRPNELLAPVGRTLRITLPENIPGPKNG